MSVPNLLRFTISWSGHGEQGDCGAYFAHAPQLYSEADLQAALVVIDGRMASSTSPSSWDLWQGHLDVAQRVTDLALYQYAATPGPSTVLAHHAPNPARPGLVNVPLAPLQTAVVASIGTGSASRRRRGRMYLPGHCSQVDADAQLPQAYCNVFKDMATLLLADVLDGLRASLPGGDPIRHVVYSRAGAMATDSTDITVDSRPDTQRRRAKSLKPVRTSPAGHVNP